MSESVAAEVRYEDGVLSSWLHFSTEEFPADAFAKGEELLALGARIYNMNLGEVSQDILPVGTKSWAIVPQAEGVEQ